MAAIHISEPSLILRAGAKARAHIQQHGLRAADIDLLPGAAGGPKGIGLLGLDRAVFGTFLPQAKRRRTLIGASVGAWRFAAVAGGGDDPARIVTNLERLADCYTRQHFPKGASAADISQRCDTFLHDVLAGCDDAILSSRDYRLVVLADRCRHVFAADHRAILFPALVGVMTANLISRNNLRAFMERTLITTGDAPVPLALPDGFRTHQVELTQHNLRAALMASAAIPLVLEGVRHLPGAPAGTYRDGGLLDYHLDLPYQTEGLVLYPHFAERVTPGWFDKPLKWRNGSPHNLSSTLLIAPSPAYLARLPNGKLPDRTDFKRYAGDDVARQRDWRRALAESERLGDEFLALVESGRWLERIQPL